MVAGVADEDRFPAICPYGWNEVMDRETAWSPPAAG